MRKSPATQKRARTARSGARTARRSRRRAFRWSRLWPGPRLRGRLRRIWRRRSATSRTAIVGIVAVMLWLGVNWIYQVIRKPSELFFPVSGVLDKTPAQTWQEYAPLFQRYATVVMTPALLAAIAQVEGAGNPVARTYWRWSWTRQPFEIFRPASSSVGMYQMTDGTFAEARRYCIRHHRVVEDGPWSDWNSCWFNSLYARVVPGDAVELTAAYLDHSVATILQRHRLSFVSLERQQELATVIHLCGAGGGDGFARHGFHLLPGQRCGSEDPRHYLSRVQSMKRVFDSLSSAVPVPGLQR